jgi:flagellin-like hook-associated protein FlgL
MNIGSTNSLFTQNMLSHTTANIARSLERLSTGKRVNRPADDPAAYSESVMLDSQARGLNQAIVNSNVANGISQTAGEAINSQLDILQRMKELTLQAMNGVYNSSQRSTLNSEFQSLLSEFTRISTDTTFDGVQLLDGSFGTKVIQIGATANGYDQSNLHIDSLQASSVFLEQIGNGNFSARTTQTSGTNAVTSTLVDVNHDGNLDLITADSSTGSVRIALGNGNGGFTNNVTYTYGSGVTGVAVGDVNGDGVADIVTADAGTNTVSILLGNGDGTFKARSTLLVGNGPSSVALGDFNHDGKLDIATTDATDKTVSILMGNGDGTFMSRTTKSGGTSMKGVQLADLNGDGNLDIVTADSGDNTVSIFLGNADGTFQNRITSSAGTTPYAISIADTNGDGKLDVAVANSGGSTVSLLLGNGNGTLQAASSITVGNAPKALTFADVNGDGVMDLISGDSTDKTVSVLIGNGNGTFKSRMTFGVGSIAGLAVGDINGDGVNDLVTADGTDATNSTLLGMGVTSSALGDLNLNRVNIIGGSSIVSGNQPVQLATAPDILGILNNAINLLKAEQANMTALHSRLEENVAGNLLLSASLSEAKENAVSSDAAMEVANLVKNQILQQAEMAVLAQGSSGLETVKGLLQNL